MWNSLEIALIHVWSFRTHLSAILIFKSHQNVYEMIHTRNDAIWNRVITCTKWLFRVHILKSKIISISKMRYKTKSQFLINCHKCFYSNSKQFPPNNIILNLPASRTIIQWILLVSGDVWSLSNIFFYFKCSSSDQCCHKVLAENPHSIFQK